MLILLWHQLGYGSILNGFNFAKNLMSIELLRYSTLLDVYAAWKYFILLLSAYARRGIGLAVFLNGFCWTLDWISVFIASLSWISIKLVDKMNGLMKSDYLCAVGTCLNGCKSSFLIDGISCVNGVWTGLDCPCFRGVWSLACVLWMQIRWPCWCLAKKSDISVCSIN